MNEVFQTVNRPEPAVSHDVEIRYPRGQRLLVVDDEAVVCQLVQAILGNAGWEVDAAASIEEGDEALEQRFYPVVLCDVHLPGDSSEFLRKWRERRPAAQVIMFTGDPTISTAREAIQFGAYEYVPKPWRHEELVRIVRRAYEKFLLLREQERLQAENEMYRRRLEEMVERRTGQLRESELRYRAIFNRAVDAIFLVDATNGVIIDQNIAAARLLKMRDAEITGRPLSSFVGDQLQEVFKQAADAQRHEWRFERIHFDTASGVSRAAQVAVNRVEFENQVCLQVVARDITDQIELLEEHARMESELLTEQRLASIGSLAAGVAHNINTPLMGIYGTAQLIKLKHPEDKDIDGVITQVERINAIIRNLMWKSRQEQDGSWREIDLNVLLNEELRFMEADLEFKHSVSRRYSLSDNLPTIMGRYSDFSQSFMNIVRNALDAMRECETKELEVSSSVVDGTIRISFRDSGCGISAQDREKIFWPYFTTKSVAASGGHPQPGRGLGLAAVKRLLEPYDAHFEIESQPNQGTTFVVCIPVARNAPSARKGEIPDES